MFLSKTQKNTVVTWRHFDRKNYSAFRSLGREIRIGVLAVSTLMAAHTDTLATRTDSLRIVKDTVSSSDYSLREATVTGSQLPVSLDKAWTKIVVITRQEIDNAQCQTINDILKLCPNVDVRQRGALGVQTDISLGGGTFDQVTFLLNGININNPQTGHLSADFPVAIADIERIEILDGASARTFGSQALNGIINIITRIDPNSNVSLHVEGGSYGSLGGGASVNTASPSLRNRLSANYFRTDGAVDNSAFNRHRLFYQGRYIADNLTLSWQAGYNRQHYGANTFYSPKYPDQWEEGTRYMAALKAETSAGAVHLQPSLSFMRNYDHYQLIRHTQTGENYHRNDIISASVSGYAGWSLGRTAFGGEMRHESILSTSLGRPLDEDRRVRVEHQHGRYYDHRDSRTNLSLFLEHAVLLRHLSLNVGVMGNRNSAVDDRLRLYPGIDVSYRPAEGLRLYFSWNKSMRMPTFTDLYYKSETQEGNVGLRPEKTGTLKLGAEYQKAWIALSLSALYRRGTDMIDWVMYSADDKYHSTAFTLTNCQLTATARADLARLMKWGRRALSMQVSYYYNHQHRHDDTFVYQSCYVLDYVRHKVQTSLDHSIVPLAQGRGLSATWYLRWQQREGTHIEYRDGQTLQRPNRPYTLVDLKLRWTMPRYSLYASLENLFSHRYYDIGTVPQPGFTLLFGAAVRIM